MGELENEEESSYYFERGRTSEHSLPLNTHSFFNPACTLNPFQYTVLQG